MQNTDMSLVRPHSGRTVMFEAGVNDTFVKIVPKCTIIIHNPDVILVRPYTGRIFSQ